MATVDKPTETKPNYKVIGTRPIRHDGVDKVTGRAKYGADTQMTGMLYGKILRSPHAHARIKSIDTSKAEQAPGVHAVITSADMPEIGSKIADLGEGMFDLKDLTRIVLAREKVVYKGHAVAAVAAETIHQAEEAARLIEVDYEPLPPVLDVRAAMQDDAPILHEDLRTAAFASATDDPGEKPTNVAKHFLHEKGDVEKGFAEAKLVIEREFTTATVHQGYIEPHTATAIWNADGQITAWTSTQGSFCVREQMSGLLQVPLSRVKIVPMEIGGGFGGKIVVYTPPIAALLSKKSGRPVKVVMDRAAVLEATGPTPGSYMRVKIGVDAEGSITAAEAYLVFEAGGFPGSPIPAACMTVFACYDVPNGLVNGYDVCVNKPASKAYRAPGATHAAFAVETIVDEICEELKIDPLEFRLKNAAVEGTRRVDGVLFPRVGMVETVEAIQQGDHWKSSLDESKAAGQRPTGSTPLPGHEGDVEKKRGRGVASGFWFNAGLKSVVTASVNTDGRVALVEGSTDIGGSRASIAMQLAETLGIAAEDVTPTVADTDNVGYTDVTGGSRVTYATGWAAYEAAMDIRRQMIARAALIWDVDAEQVEYRDGSIIGPDDKVFTFQELAAQINKTGEPIIGRGSSAHDEPGGAFGTHCVDVEIDPDTGKVEILRYTIAQDAGTAIHPAYVEGQLQGGVVQGIGWALNEEYVYDEQGVMQNASLLDYRMPTCFDVPMIDTIIVEVPNPGHPYGVRGVGEVPIVPPPAAITNAIYDAVGVRMRHLPMSPPNLLPEILKNT
ncbi:MAG: xanthine dehydrogenase family protein molybdopterin-binding subunit [Planctomycetaceae bacterium]|jgi:xanthine dehydrogenase molybdenum-binding subunit|nr:xanthine dehydrogenase family protein molybdopterin-binding subunit [Planctomycetaceae bacterium]MBT6157008.1 xanthine dehydrogenase family protein molybdopterin-binding subunit [Planctomycetaceae bacterium]MBT6484426.1 xanthine dehydrogenase family protein molybdopterin-binding subunit [Planctomycetaceae bacterium]MBT6494667.1 xanthine dehydrogenase family protein molybdopterin-binding subunit [Planctomycetaceae bacterium]